MPRDEAMFMTPYVVAQVCTRSHVWPKISYFCHTKSVPRLTEIMLHRKVFASEISIF